MRTRLIGLALLFLGIPVAASAQFANLTWTQAVAGSQTKVYKATCTVPVVNNTCATPGPFTLVATVATGNTYNDGNVAAGQQLAYRVTTFCVTTATLDCSRYTTPESVTFSNVLGYAIPAAPIPLPPPINLSRITTAHTFTPSAERVVATWTAPPRSRATYVLSSDRGEIRRATLYAGDGRFYMSWFSIWKFRGKEPNLRIEVCMAGSTECVSKLVDEA